MNRSWMIVAVLAGLGASGTRGLAIAATRLDAASSEFSNVRQDYQITSNGQWVVYRSRPEGAATDSLYCVPIAGGIPVRLNGLLNSGGSIESWQLSPDGTRVVYLADQETVGLTEVYVTPMPTGAAQKVNDALVEHGSMRGAFAGAAGNQVAYIAGKVTGPITGTFYEIFSVPTGGTA